LMNLTLIAYILHKDQYLTGVFDRRKLLQGNGR